MKLQTKILSEATTELSALKTLISSPDSFVNKRIEAVEAKMGKHVEIITKQPHYLDSKERESNLLLLLVPVMHDVPDGEVTDEEKLNRSCHVLE